MAFLLRKVDESAAGGYNPYLAARLEWDERYGSVMSRARHWRIAAFLALMIAGASVAFALSMVHRISRVPPFVAVVNGTTSQPIASGFAEPQNSLDDRLKRAALLNWLEDFRLVTVDGIAQRKAIEHVYSMLGSGTSAQTVVSDWYRNETPAKRAGKGTVTAEVSSVLPTSDRTYQLDWTETTRDLYGAVKSSEHWKASALIAVNPPKDDLQARRNPLGIYVTSVSWSKVL
jgi:type IV secretion system protein VirB5